MATPFTIERLWLILWIGEWFYISMAITNDINVANAIFIRMDKNDNEKIEEKTKYNSFMNFMTDIVLKYGLNNNLDENDKEPVGKHTYKCYN